MADSKIAAIYIVVMFESLESSNYDFALIQKG